MSRTRLRAFVTFVVVGVLMAAQWLLIFVGWRAVCDQLAIIFPNQPLWGESPMLRNGGLVFGLVCILYPVYFGLFGLGEHLRASKPAATPTI